MDNKQPPPEYHCYCGNPAPYNWKRTNRGEYMCTNCAMIFSKANSCPMCTVVYKKNQMTNTDLDKGPWIGCDDCETWVHSRCDGIEDVSVFDDSNPNPQHYSCPFCRGFKQDPFSEGADLTHQIAGHKEEDEVAIQAFMGSFDSVGARRRKRELISSSYDSEPVITLEDMQEGLNKSFEKYLKDTQVKVDRSRRATLKTLEGKFKDNLQAHKSQLALKRNTVITRYERAYERKIAELMNEDEKNQSTVQRDFANQLRMFYQQQLAEFEREREFVVNGK
eukprot:TRINITY_DN910_c1_g1_i2.p1 TRINITY_DN910_c1_g1~~TRINITY_DN910_c1_g1_i2.p1  ORF type:complete len:278 (+),score=83.33 TRINITY_DN910_c1_g1_i2:1766-2599(+)